MKASEECKTLNALLIEDNSDDAELLIRHIKRVKQQDILVTHRDTLAGGLESLVNGGIEIVLLDLSLPDSFGLETVSKVRKEFPTIPVVVLTGSDDDNLAVQVLKTGAQDYLVKDNLDSSSLGRSINYAIERQRGTSILQWLEAVVNGSNDAIIGLSVNNTVVSWNQGAERIFKHSAVEVIGRPLAEFLPLNVVNAPLLNERCRRNQFLEPYEVTYITEGGSETTVYISTSPIADGDGILTGVSLIVHDLTQQRLTERRLRLALESVGMECWDWDLTNGELWRSAYYDTDSGYHSLLPEWSHGSFLDYIIPEDYSVAEQQIKDAFVVGKIDLQCRIQSKDSNTQWIAVHGETKVNAQGIPIRMMGVISDISASKRLEQQAIEATKRRDQLFEDIVEYAPIGLVILDSSLKITAANPAFSQIINKDQSSLLGMALSVVLPTEAFPALESALASGKQFQESRLQVSVSNERSSESRYWDLSLWPIRNDAGEIVEVVMQVLDCTATVLLEKQRDDFVASVAHDIKNPLIGAERMFTVLCQQTKGESPAGFQQMLTVLRDGNQNLLSLVQNLVDVYRYETLTYPCNYEDVDINSLVRSCINQMSHFAESHEVVFDFERLEDEGYIQADAIGLRRVMMNLLHNAVKFNKRGGSIVIRIDKTDQQLELKVRDTGAGIEESDQKKLFQRFSQGMSGKNSSGSGLGLYLSKQILEAHGGCISCTSVVGVGTEFLITLPLSSPLQDNSTIQGGIFPLP